MAVAARLGEQPTPGAVRVLLLMRAGVATLRRREVGRERPDGCRAKGERVIFACWHGWLLMMPLVKED